MPFKISKKYLNTDWNSLALINDVDGDWSKGVQIIKDRFDSRFFIHLNRIAYDEFSGFLVMSIDCLLIESLMQFYLGVDNTEINYAGNQWKAFGDFFKHSPQFNTDFTTNTISKTFYKHFRCGLLHQAQTKEKSLIKISQPAFLSFIDASDVTAGMIVDRNQFHSKLVQEFNEYILRLTNNENNFKGNNLRMKAIAKMDLICTE